MKIRILLFFLMIPLATFADKKVRIDSIQVVRDSIMLAKIRLVEQIEIDLSLKNRYKLYQTENIYTFLELDTKTGRINQVQWSLDAEKEGSIEINDEDLSMGYGSGTFELYPTKNMYQFILLDKTDGRKWHVQWGIGNKNRWIRRIW